MASRGFADDAARRAWSAACVSLDLEPAPLHFDERLTFFYLCKAEAAVQGRVSVSTCDVSSALEIARTAAYVAELGD